MLKVVQIGFKLRVPLAEYRRIVASLAPAFAAVPGLRWKLWLLNELAGVASTVVLFEDEVSRDAFLASDLATRFQDASFHRGLEIRLFDTMPEATQITRGPAPTGAVAPPV